MTTDEERLRRLLVQRTMAFRDACAALAHTTVLATLRQVAQWLPDPYDGRVAGAADAVEVAGVDCAVCPLCEEVTCDPGCGLAPWRWRTG